MNNERITYKGKKVFIGIDVHKVFYQVACYCEGVKVKSFRSKSEPLLMAEQLSKYFSGAKIFSCYEAGFTGFKLHRILIEAGINNIVVNAGDIQVSARKDKSDKRDSNKLALQLSAGLLRGIRVPKKEEEDRRQLTRTREQLVRHRTRVMNQIRMRFHYYGMISADNRQRMSLSLVSELLDLVDSKELRASINCLVDLWKNIELQIKSLEKELRQQAKNDHCEAVYRMLPGVGPLTSRVLSNELGDLRKFPNQKALFRFTGLVPGEHSTGDKDKQLNISKEGNSRIRYVMIEAAWSSLSKDKDLKEYFESLAKRVGKKKAIVALARKLIGIARALFVKEVQYQTAL